MRALILLSFVVLICGGIVLIRVHFFRQLGQGILLWGDIGLALVVYLWWNWEVLYLLYVLYTYFFGAHHMTSWREVLTIYPITYSIGRFAMICVMATEYFVEHFIWLAAMHLAVVVGLPFLWWQLVLKLFVFPRLQTYLDELLDVREQQEKSKNWTAAQWRIWWEREIEKDPTLVEYYTTGKLFRQILRDRKQPLSYIDWELIKAVLFFGMSQTLAVNLLLHRNKKREELFNFFKEKETPRV